MVSALGVVVWAASAAALATSPPLQQSRACATARLVRDIRLQAPATAPALAEVSGRVVRVDLGTSVRIVRDASVSGADAVVKRFANSPGRWAGRVGAVGELLPMPGKSKRSAKLAWLKSLDKQPSWVAPKRKLPSLNLKPISLPSVNLPSVSLPEVSLPELKLPKFAAKPAPPVEVLVGEVAPPTATPAPAPVVTPVAAAPKPSKIARSADKAKSAWLKSIDKEPSWIKQTPTRKLKTWLKRR